MMLSRLTSLQLAAREKKTMPAGTSSRRGTILNNFLLLLSRFTPPGGGLGATIWVRIVRKKSAVAYLSIISSFVGVRELVYIKLNELLLQSCRISIQCRMETYLPLTYFYNYCAYVFDLRRSGFTFARIQQMIAKREGGGRKFKMSGQSVAQRRSYQLVGL